MAEEPTARLYELFANLLEYPTPALARQAQACGERLAEVRPEAAGLLERFCRTVEDAPLERMEELYTSTFDMQPVSYPYVGYHLFGESYKRGIFMAQLNGGYHERGFSAGSELPDHVAVVLRFLALTTAGTVVPWPACHRKGSGLHSAQALGTPQGGQSLPKGGREDDFSRALLYEGLVPTLGKMAQAFGDQNGNPYAAVVSALLQLLTDKTEGGMGDA